jgi:hypothetical protein
MAELFAFRCSEIPACASRSPQVFAMAFNAMIISACSSAMAAIDYVARHHKAKLDRVRDYMRFNYVPPDLTHTIMEFYKYCHPPKSCLLASTPLLTPRLPSPSMGTDCSGRYICLNSQTQDDLKDFVDLPQQLHFKLAIALHRELITKYAHSPSLTSFHRTPHPPAAPYRHRHPSPSPPFPSARCNLFVEFDNNSILRILSFLRPLTLPPETVVIRQGHRHSVRRCFSIFRLCPRWLLAASWLFTHYQDACPQAMYFVSRGMLWAVEDYGAATQRLVEALGQHEFFGDEGIVSGALPTYSVVAKTCAQDAQPQSRAA